MTQHGARRETSAIRDLSPHSSAEYLWQPLAIYILPPTCNILPLETIFSWLACTNGSGLVLGLPASGPYTFDPRARAPHQDLTPPSPFLIYLLHIPRLNPLNSQHSSPQSPSPNSLPILSIANMTTSELASRNAAIFGVCTACPRKA